jgi:hypothetical protein
MDLDGERVAGMSGHLHKSKWSDVTGRHGERGFMGVAATHAFLRNKALRKVDIKVRMLDHIPDGEEKHPDDDLPLGLWAAPGGRG